MTAIEIRQRINILRTQGLPYVLLLSFCFGTSTIASRYVLREMNSISYIGVRMTISTTCFVLLFLLSKKHKLPRNRQIWKHGMVLGVIGTALPMMGFITALTYLSAGVTSIISTVGPALTVTLAHFILKDDKMDLTKVLGVVIALSGALMLVLRGETGLGIESNPIGYLFILGSTISSSIGVIYARRYVTGYSPVEVTSVRALTAMAIALPLGIFVFGIDLPALSGGAWVGIVYGSTVSTFAGFILSLWIVTNFGVATSIMTNYMVPIIATVAGFLLLGEQITQGMIFGMAVIMTGIYLINSRGRRLAPTVPKGH